MHPWSSPWRFCVAPMMDWTDRHCRYFHRQLSGRARLYTEMITDAAIIHGNAERLLRFSVEEQPVAIQLGGSRPAMLARAARMAADFGYIEINMNVGCPSDRVKEGRFGACLMAEPELVGDCIAAMKEAVGVPVTLKCRIGIDDQDPETALDAVVAAAVTAGVDAVIVHARKALLQGLSPKQNRDIPPLNYDRVYRLKRDNPGLPVILNGGVDSVEAARAHLDHVDGVMLGRAAYREPWRLLAVDYELFGDAGPAASPKAAALAMLPYIERELAAGTPLYSIVRHWVGLFHAVPGARRFRQKLAMLAAAPEGGLDALRAALDCVPDRIPEWIEQRTEAA